MVKGNKLINFPSALKERQEKYNITQYIIDYSIVERDSLVQSLERREKGSADLHAFFQRVCSNKVGEIDHKKIQREYKNFVSEMFFSTFQALRTLTRYFTHSFMMDELIIPDPICQKFIDLCTVLHLRGQFGSFFKTNCAYIFSLAYGQELPEVPPFFEELNLIPGVFGSGVLYRLSKRLQRRRFKVDSTMNSLLNGVKRGFETSPLWLIDLAIKKHENALTGEANIPKLISSELGYEVIRTIREIFNDIKPETKVAFKIPSSSAHYSTTRKDGGALGTLLLTFREKIESYSLGYRPHYQMIHRYGAEEEIPEMEDSEYQSLEQGELLIEESPTDSNNSETGPPPISAEERRACREARANASRKDVEDGNVTFVEGDTTYNIKLEYEFELPDWFRMNATSYMLYSYVRDVDDTTEDFLSFVIEEINSRPDGPSQYLKAKPVGLPEGMDKIRVITGGDEYAYYLALYIQKCVHSWLRKHPVFRLIGKPLDLESLDSTFTHKLLPGQIINSGDYSAATDKIHKDLSLLAANTISDLFGFSSFYRELFCATLCYHILSYVSGEKKQENGQLMGSPSSFPILCIINAAETRKALEISTGKEVKLRSAPILINGDDIVFAEPRVEDQVVPFFPLWRARMKECGLSLSVGKSYRSTKWLCMNSSFFNVKFSVDYFGCFKPNFRFVPYVNYGILFAQNIKGGKSLLHNEGSYRYGDISSLFRELLQGHNKEMTNVLMSEALSNWKPLLSKAPRGMNWFFPKHLGGLGLPITDLSKVTYSKEQVKLAMYLHSTCDPQFYIQRLSWLQEKVGEASLFQKAFKLIPKNHLKLEFIDEPCDIQSWNLGTYSGELRTSGTVPVDEILNQLLPSCYLENVNTVWGGNGLGISLDFNVQKNIREDQAERDFKRIWKKGQAHSIPSIPLERILALKERTVVSRIEFPSHDLRTYIDLRKQC